MVVTYPHWVGINYLGVSPRVNPNSQQIMLQVEPRNTEKHKMYQEYFDTVENLISRGRRNKTNLKQKLVMYKTVTYKIIENVVETKIYIMDIKINNRYIVNLKD